MESTSAPEIKARRAKHHIENSFHEDDSEIPISSNRSHRNEHLQRKLNTTRSFQENINLNLKADDTSLFKVVLRPSSGQLDSTNRFDKSLSPSHASGKINKNETQFNINSNRRKPSAENENRFDSPNEPNRPVVSPRKNALNSTGQNHDINYSPRLNEHNSLRATSKRESNIKNTSNDFSASYDSANSGIGTYRNRGQQQVLMRGIFTFDNRSVDLELHNSHLKWKSISGKSQRTVLEISNMKSFSNYVFFCIYCF